jgi:stage II sporulation protein D
VISEEPKINVGVLDRCREVRGVFHGTYTLNGSDRLIGGFGVRSEEGAFVLSCNNSKYVYKQSDLFCRAETGSTFTLKRVTIGIQFHWEKEEDEEFSGALRLKMRNDGTIAAINEINLEAYLASVISSEMSGEAPTEFLKAHAIVSRSWLAAMLGRSESGEAGVLPRTVEREGELLRWYDREDHDLYDVCADDHCQRYQGISKIKSGKAVEAVEATRGVFIMYRGEICDARFSKACGGLTEDFENTWEEKHLPFLVSVSDAETNYPAIVTEGQAEDWILSNPNAYCNTTDRVFLRQILPSFDRETTSFFRWAIDYDRERLENLIREKSGFDCGTLLNLVPVQRGPSGRIVKLRIEGSRQTIVVGKELEIRRWLSETHLYSSAFVVMTECGENGVPKRFLLYGAGWGHGVGMCQVGAAVMAAKGFNAETILGHYYRQSELANLY